jgi:hypothetical protein
VSGEEVTKERAILRAVRRALRGIVEDTAGAPGLKQILKERTREDIYQCFVLIEERERELSSCAPSSGSGEPAPETDPHGGVPR